jgi:hypothetical protein
MAQIKELHNELLAKEEKYNEELAVLEREKKELKTQLAHTAAELTKSEDARREDEAQRDTDNEALKTQLTLAEEKLKDYETNYVKKVDNTAGDKQLKELLSKYKEENARLKDELKSQTRAGKEVDEEAGLLKVPRPCYL